MYVYTLKEEGGTRGGGGGGGAVCSKLCSTTTPLIDSDLIHLAIGVVFDV